MYRLSVGRPRRLESVPTLRWTCVVRIADQRLGAPGTRKKYAQAISTKCVSKLGGIAVMASRALPWLPNFLLLPAAQLVSRPRLRITGAVE